VIFCYIAPAREPVRYRDKSIGFETNFRKCFGPLSAIGLLTALMTASAYAQVRVGEAAVVENKVRRVAGPSTTQINVGAGLRIPC